MPNLRELTDRDRAVLAALARYRIVTGLYIEKRLCGGSSDAKKKLLARLEGLVTSGPLFGSAKHYRFTTAGAKFVGGVPEEAGNPPQSQALVKLYGRFAFCALGDREQFLYTRIEFSEDFPELVEDFIGRDYFTDFYLDHDGSKPLLGQIVVDVGGGDYGKLISKCRALISKRVEGPARSLVLEGRLAVAIVVGEESKRVAIEEALKERPLRALTRVHVAQNLSDLIGRSN